MTPCEELGYKVGDKFICKEGWVGFTAGQTITLYRDDNSTAPLFSGENPRFSCCDGKPGAFMGITNVIKIEDSEMNKEFTKDMLTTGMRVVTRAGIEYIVVDDKLYRYGGFIPFENYSHDLVNTYHKGSDIANVYDRPGDNDFLNIDEKGELLWERKEETEQQKQIKELEVTIKKAQEQINKIKEGI